MPKFQFLKPNMAIDLGSLIRELLRRRLFWAIFGTAVALNIALVIYYFYYPRDIDIFVFSPYFFVILYAAFVFEEIRGYFWREFAELHGWRYEKKGDPKQEAGLMFQQGTNRKIRNVVVGAIDGRQFRSFIYEFTVQRNKKDDSDTYRYTVFTFKFNGKFPHIYLNNAYNQFGVSFVDGERVPIPAECEKKFHLFAPKKYEIEALEIFTPNVLHWVMEQAFNYDIELIGDQLLIFADGHIESFDELEKKFNDALELEDLFDDKLDRMKFVPIGDLPHVLNNKKASLF